MERVEELEHTMAMHQEIIDDCEKEILCIEERRKSEHEEDIEQIPCTHCAHIEEKPGKDEF